MLRTLLMLRVRAMNSFNRSIYIKVVKRKPKKVLKKVVRPVLDGAKRGHPLGF